MTYLIVSGNESCIVPGGVESFLKWNRSNGRGGGQQGRGVEDSLSQFDSSLSLNDGSVEDFDQANSNNVIDTATNTTATKRAPSSGGGLGFLKSGLKKAQGAIERSVTTMAIRADGGKNPDWVCASLHYRADQNGSGVNATMASGMGVQKLPGDVCLSRTEWIRLPSGSSGIDNGGGLAFTLPLSVPDFGFMEAAASGGEVGGGGVRLTVRLYIRSGAALLNMVKREYCVGECSVQYADVLRMASGVGKQQQTQQQSSINYSSSVNLPLTGGMLSEPISYSTGASSPPAAIKITATPRIKFNQPCTFGWSLTDPISTPPVTPLSWLKMFQLPLDQAYAFPILNHHQLLNAHQINQQRSSSNATLLMNETAVESTLTLPIATAVSRLLSSAAMQSQQIASMTAARTFRRESLRSYAIPPDDEFKGNAIASAAMKDGCADVAIGVVALVLIGEAGMGAAGGNGGAELGLDAFPTVRANLSFQRHDSIFEEPLANSFSLPLLDEVSGSSYINNPAAGLGPKEAVTTRFCPRILSGISNNDEDAALLPGIIGTKPNGKYVGNVRLEVLCGSYSNGTAQGSEITTLEGIVELEPHLEATQQQQLKIPVLCPAIDTNNGRRVGTFLLLVRVRTETNSQTQIRDSVPDAKGGLISVVGLDTLAEEMGLFPSVDCSINSDATNATASGIRQRQVATMGSFITPGFLKQQAEQRTGDAAMLSERYDKYFHSVLSGVSPDVTTEDESDVPLFKRRTPRPFRPSNSRPDQLLAGLGFNVHVQAVSLSILQDGNAAIPAAVYHSVTHGAPADHARGFGGVKGTDSGENGARGGLRRLETKRLELAKEVDVSENVICKSQFVWQIRVLHNSLLFSPSGF